MPKFTAIYVRVSTDKQTTKSQDADLQRYSDSVEGEVKFFRDSASGGSMDRPAWNRLDAAMRAGRVCRVVVWRLDRLGRTAAGLTALFETLTERKVDLVSLKDGLTLATPAGRMMAGVLASLAQYETEIRGERVRAGQQAALAAGKRWGGSEAGKRKKVTVEQERTIHRLKGEGTPVTRIAKAVGLSRPTVYDVLKAG